MFYNLICLILLGFAARIESTSPVKASNLTTNGGLPADSKVKVCYSPPVKNAPTDILDILSLLLAISGMYFLPRVRRIWSKFSGIPLILLHMSCKKEVDKIVLFYNIILSLWIITNELYLFK